VGRPLPMDDWGTLATGETIATLRSAGLVIETWTILSESNRLVLELKPCQLIAKAVPTDVYDRLALEVAVSQHVIGRSNLSSRPATRSGPFRGATVAVSVWEPFAELGTPSEPAICDAYAELRACLDSYTQTLPDFRDAIRAARLLAERMGLPAVPEADASLVRTSFDRALSCLGSFHWTPRVLHGDPHSGNIVLTPNGPLWFDLESVCTGPVEWDLSALPASARGMGHDRELLAALTTIRRACVVTWCASKARPTPPEADAIIHHLSALKREGEAFVDSTIV
jgi:hypothetical protein